MHIDSSHISAPHPRADLGTQLGRVVRTRFLYALALVSASFLIFEVGTASAHPGHTVLRHNHDDQQSAAALDRDGDRDTARRPAVAQSNFRLGARYEGRFVDETAATSASGGALSTLAFEEFDTHRGVLNASATIPLTHSTGARARLAGSFASENRDESAGSPNSETGTFGAGFDLFVRDPALGSFTLGADYERFDGDDDYEANAYQGRAELMIFFPDLGSGPVDWFVDFRYTRLDDAGATRAFVPNRDRFSVEGGAGWYFDENVQWLVGGRWSLAENEDAEIEDREGFAGLRWFLPIAADLSVELDVRGFAGVSDYQEDPFRSDSRFVYGARGGVTVRFRSGATLLESVRAYD